MISLSNAVKAALVVSTMSFAPQGMIPKQFSCDGQSVNPALHIDNIPQNAQSLAIIVHDPDAPMKGGFTHWVTWNIDPTKDIPENFTGGEQGLNGKKESGYTGPCPPSGTHHYHFMVYALDTKLQLDKNTDKSKLEKAMKGHVLAQGEIIGLYTKNK